MASVLIQAGHWPAAGGAPGEAQWAMEFAEAVQSRLWGLGHEATIVGDWFDKPAPAAVRKDYDLFYAVHYDAAIYTLNTGCFFDRAQQDPMRHWSDAFGRLWEQKYPRLSGIPLHNERRNARTYHYYGFDDTTARTPGVLVEHGVGAPGAGWDAATLREHLPALADCVVACIAEYLELKLVPLASPLWDGAWPITQVYGVCPEDYPWVAGHDGLDVGMPAGTWLYTPDDGEVIFSGDLGDGWGERIDYLDRWGRLWRFGHLSFRSARIGERLDRGNLLGRSGNTGRSSGDHLHLGLLPPSADANNGYYGWVDPLPAVRALASGEDEMTEAQRAILDVMAGLGADAGSITGWINEIGALNAVVAERQGVIDQLNGVNTTLQQQVNDLRAQLATADRRAVRVDLVYPDGSEQQFVPQPQ